MLKDYEETINNGVEVFRNYYLQKKEELRENDAE